MANHLFVTRQAVSRWEGGSRYPDLLTAKKMAQFLEVSLDELLSDDDMKLYVEKTRFWIPWYQKEFRQCWNQQVK